MSLIPFNRGENALASKDPFTNMLDSFFNDAWMPTRNLLSDTFKIDVKEEDGGYVVEADLPGVERDEINLDMHDGRLTISVARTEKKEDKRENYIHQERRFSSMQRALYLKDASDDDVEASLKDGVLKIEVKKASNRKDAKRIEIR